MSNLKKTQLESLNETMKKAYKKIKEIDMDDLSVMHSIDVDANEDRYREKKVKNSENDFKNLDFKNKKIGQLTNYTKSITDSLDEFNNSLNKDIKELEDMIYSIEKELKSI